MTKYLIGADNINGKEHAYINRMLKFLKDNGHQATSLGVGPNVVQRRGGSSSSKGYIGVQIVGGNGGGTPSDAMLGIKNGYYHYDYWITIGSYEFTHNSLLKTSMMDTKVNRCEPGMSSIQCNLYRGMTPNQWNEKYGKYADYVFSVQPGLSGMWQISGRSDTGYEERITLDSYYIQNWSIWLDLWILIKTVYVVIKRKGAY